MYKRIAYEAIIGTTRAAVESMTYHRGFRIQPSTMSTRVAVTKLPFAVKDPVAGRCHHRDLDDQEPNKPRALSRTLSRALNITATTVIAGQVIPIRTTIEQPLGKLVPTGS